MSFLNFRAYLLFVLLLVSMCLCALWKASFAATAGGAATTKYQDYVPDDPAFVRKFLKPGTYMRESEIKPGMEGYGLSVFRGSKIEKFDVKVIGVMRRTLNGKNAILVRISGPAMGKNNVIRGMSGSPVFIDGKLIGAVSYGFDFSTEPIAGITPIVDMLDAIAKPSDAPKVGWDSGQPQEGKASALKSENKLSLPVSPYVIPGASRELGSLRRQMVSSTAPRMVPLMSPICLSGFSTRAQEALGKRLERFGLTVTEGTGGGMDPDIGEAETKEVNALKPGSSVGVMLTTGDFESAAVGTVTQVFSDRVLAFGHPFVQAGMVDFPMTSAYIHDVLPSLSISFKLSSPVKILGTVFSDRPWSVGGELGGKAKMVPVTIEVSDDERHIKKSYVSQVIDHQDLTPELIAACAMSAIDATYQSSIPYIARVESIVESDKVETIKRFDCLSNTAGGSGLASTVFKGPFFTDPVAGNIYAITARILSNKYENVHLKKVVLKIKLDTGRNLTRIVRVSTDKAQVHPGDTVKLNCTLAPYDGEMYRETLEVTIPRDAPDGDMVVGVCGGTQLDELRRRMGLVDPPATNLNQIVRKIQERAQGDRLFAVLALPDQAIHIDGEVIQSPPGHWNKLFFSNRYTHGPALVSGERRTVQPVDGLLEGSHILSVDVKRRDEYMARQPWFQASPKGSARPNLGVYITTQAQKAIDAMGKTDSKVKTDATTTGTTETAQATAAKAQSLNLYSPTGEDPHIRGMQIWNQVDESSFKGGTRDGITVDSWGRMFPAFQEAGVVSVDTALRSWSGTWANGAFYFSSSDRVYKLSAMNGKPEELAKFNSVAIPSIAVDSKGRVYAALAPQGKIVSIDPSTPGSPKDVAKFNENLITCLCLDGQDNLYAGVAGTGNVYKVVPGGQTVLLFDSGQAHITSMFYDKSADRLLVGCGEQGNVYSIGKDGKVKAEYHSDDHLVTGLCRTRKGDLYVATTGDGHLVRVNPAGEVFDLATSEAFYSLFYHPETDSIFAGDAEGDITQIREEPLTGQAFFIPVKHTTQEAVVAISADPNGTLYGLTSNLPTVYAFKIKPPTASFTSPVKDAGRKSKWSHIRIYGSFNEVSANLQKMLSVECRSGNTVQPDESWTAWTPALSSSDGYKIQNADARYFQYRVKWADMSGSPDDHVFPTGRGSVIGRISVTYLPTNLQPRFSAVSVRAGSYISDTEDVSITGTDPDGDSLAFNIDISSDDGKTWKSLQDDLRPEKTTKGKTEKDSKKGKKGETPKTGDSKAGADKKAPKSKEKENAEEGEESFKDPGSQKIDSKNGSSDDDSGSEGITPGADSESTPGESGSGDNPSGGSDNSTDGTESDSLSSRGDHMHRPWAQRSTLDVNRLQTEEQPKKSDDKSEDKSKDKSEDKAKEPADEKNKDKSQESATKKTDPKSAKGKPSETAAELKTKKPTVEPTEKFAWPFLTKTMKDGHYILRFTLTDAPSNMVNPQEMKCYRYVVIDNTKPKIDSVKTSFASNGTLDIDARVSDQTSPVINATFTIDEGEPRAFAVEGDVADALDLHLLARGVKVRKGARKVEIEVVDKAGNKFSKSVKIAGH